MIRSLGFFIGLGCLTALQSLAQDPQAFEIRKTVTKIQIDGLLNESAWEAADTIPLAYETNPGNNLAAEVKTFLRMAYDQENLYFSFEASDPNAKTIRAIINDRDKLDDNDFVTLSLDPFNDTRRAFFFTVNPLGVQQDGVYDAQTDDGDLSWDAIWNSAGTITTDGYIVEAAIPFKSLRFPETKNVQTWRFHGSRVYPRSIEKVFHTMPIDQDNNCLLCQANLVTGLQGIKPGRNLEFTPTFTINRFDENPDFPEGQVGEGPVRTNVGLDARWGITTDLTMNLTLNPDFSQVEADAAQLDVNNRFALQFPEKRPFFLEGADFFNTPLSAFFSRTIADPSFGAKITGKVNKNAVGLLVARDEVNNLILPGFQGSDSYTNTEQVHNVIARYRRDVGDDANVGLLYTDRSAENYFNRVGGVDVFYRPWRPITVRTQYLRAGTRYDSLALSEHDLPTGTIHGDAYNLQIRYDTRNWTSSLFYQSRGEAFRADAGFLPQVDLRNYSGWLQRTWWPAGASWYSNFGWNIGFWKRESLGGTLDIGGMWTSAFFNGPLQLNYWINPDIVWQQYDGTTYELRRLWTGFDIQPLGNLGINGFINFGPAVDFENGRKADNLQFRLESDIRVGKHVDMTINHRYLHLHLQGNTIFIANLTQWQAAYNFNPRTFFRIILQYRHTLRNPELFEDRAVNRVDESVFAQLLLSYKLNPQSVVFLGYVDNHSGLENMTEFQQVPLTQINQTIFFKVGYAWRP